MEGAAGYLAHSVLLWLAASASVRAFLLNHAGAGFTGNAAYSYLHSISPGDLMPYPYKDNLISSAPAVLS